MLVYRVEHPTLCIGPYRSASNFSHRDDMLYDHCDSRNHPHPHCDTLTHFDMEEHVCACASIESLVSWFDTWLIPLADEGFVISVYQVDDTTKVSKRTGQCVFYKYDAVLVQSKPIFPTDNHNV